jgi:adenylate cyclase
MVQIYAAAGFGTGDLADALGSIGPLARQAVSLDANNAVARSCVGFALFARGDYNGALVEAERALALSPNLAVGYWQRGNTLIFAGQPEQGVTDLRTSLRLDPRGPNLALRLFHVAIGCYFSRAYEDAVAAANNAIRAFPEWPQSYRFRAAALGQLGRTEEAKVALEKAIAVAPAAFDMYVRGRPPSYRSEDHAHLLEGLRRAGWEG